VVANFHNLAREGKKRPLPKVQREFFEKDGPESPYCKEKISKVAVFRGWLQISLQTIEVAQFFGRIWAAF